MSKKKTNEINDIIDSSYAEADYSYSNDYYDEVYSHRPRHDRNTQHNIGSNPFTKISATSSYTPAPVSNTTSNTFNASNTSNASNASNASNIFMKYTNANTNTEKEKSNNTTTTPNEVKNTEDEFPSLGGSKKPNNASVLMPAPMNFKKVVETKKPVEIQQVVHTKPKPNPKNDDYYSRLKTYEEVKYYSEKNARSKIYNRAYSDDDEEEDEDGNYDDDD